MLRNIQIAAKKTEEQYKGALVAEGVFEDTLEADDLRTLIDDGLNGVFTATYPEGTVFLLTVKVDPPNESRS